MFVVHGYKPAYNIGGPIHSVSALAENLSKRGHKVIVFTTDSNQNEKLNVKKNCPIIVDGVEVWYFETKNIFENGFFKNVPYFSKSIGYLYSSLMRDKLVEFMPKIDVVHTHLPFIYPTYIASKIAHRFNKPLFYHQRGVLSEKALQYRSIKKKLYLNLIEKFIIRQAERLIALTQYESEIFRKYCAKNQQISIIPNGIDTKQFDHIVKKNVFNIDESKIVILFMGRLHPSKGANILFHAFLNAFSKNSKLMLVMAGPDEYGLMEDFESIIHDRNLQDHVLFPGMVVGDLKNQLLSRADLFVLPSSSEGFSMAILEALASSTPVLISPECNFNEIELANAGKIVPNDIDLISNMILKLTKDKLSLKRMGENGRNFVSKNYNWETITDQFIDLYKNVK